MKRILIFVLSFFLVFVFILSSSAASFSPSNTYVNASANASKLVHLLFSLSSFDPFKSFVVFRTGAGSYIGAYNISGSYADLVYFINENSSSDSYIITYSSDSNFSFSNPRHYLLYGNLDEYCFLDNSNFVFQHYYLSKFTLPFIVVLLIYFIFRLKKHGREVRFS